MNVQTTIEQYRLLLELATRFPSREAAPPEMRPVIDSLLRGLELPAGDYCVDALEAAFTDFLQRTDEQVAAQLRQVRLELLRRLAGKAAGAPD